MSVSRADIQKTLQYLQERLQNLQMEVSSLLQIHNTLDRELREFEPHKDNSHLEKRGRFVRGELVEWTGHMGMRHRGRILIEVDPKTYPERQLRKKIPGMAYNARTRGFYRYEESYLVEDEDGQQWWPRAGWLRRPQPGGNQGVGETEDRPLDAEEHSEEGSSVEKDSRM